MVKTLKIGDETKKEMIKFYQENIREKTPPYAIFQADSADSVITLYESGKVLFQGPSADIDFQLWLERDKKLHPENSNRTSKKPEKEKKLEKINIQRYDYDVIGSDEVGTGDFFGPIIVTSAFVSKENVKNLEKLNIVDSKNINDLVILDLAPKIMKLIPYETVVLNNEDYNLNHSKDFNMNKIKAVLHNRVLLALQKRTTNYQHIVVDQFTSPKSYFFYLRDAKTVCKNIKFIEKAENKSLAVASAAIISRYFFIKQMKKLSDEYQVKIPFGAGANVDKAALKIKGKYGLEIFSKIAKLNFKNFQKIKE